MRELARRSGVDASTLSRVIDGERARFTPEAALAISQETGLPFAALCMPPKRSRKRRTK